MKYFLKKFMPVIFVLMLTVSAAGCIGPADPAPAADTDRMPVIKINVENGAEINGNAIDQPYYKAGISVGNCPEAFAFMNAAAEVKVRGNDSARYEKKPFRIKFENAIPMLGLNNGRSFRNWVLLAEVKDASFLRNASALFLANEIMNENIYISDYRHVELYINDKYWGVYLLAEQQQMNTGRALDKEDLPGENAGTDIPYFFEMTGDALAIHKEGLTGRYFSLMYKAATTVSGTAANRQGNSYYRIRSDIADPTLNPAQREFLKNRVQSIYNLCYDATYNRSYPSGAASAKEAVETVIDLDSLVSMYLLSDIACDFDLDNSSFFFSLDMSASGSQKLIFDAPWDYDVSQGLYNPETVVQYAGGGWGAFNYSNISGDPSRDWVNSWRGNQNAWFMLFAKEQWFQDLVAVKWEKLVNAKTLENLAAYQNGITEKYAEQFARNFEKWPISPHVQHYMAVEEVNACKNQADGAAYLKTWHGKRFAFLNEIYL